MARVVSVGRQDFEKLREKNNFYIDKTRFLVDWWRADDEVTLTTLAILFSPVCQYLPHVSGRRILSLKKNNLPAISSKYNVDLSSDAPYKNRSGTDFCNLFRSAQEAFVNRL